MDNIIIKLSNDDHQKLKEYEKQFDKTPDWWKGIITLSNKAVIEAGELMTLQNETISLLKEQVELLKQKLGQYGR